MNAESSSNSSILSLNMNESFDKDKSILDPAAEDKDFFPENEAHKFGSNQSYDLRKM